MINVLILCGGKGTRISNLTKGLPKHFLYIFDNENLISRLIRQFCFNEEVDQVHLIAGGNKKEFEDYMSSKYYKQSCQITVHGGQNQSKGFDLYEVLKLENVSEQVIWVMGDSFFLDSDIKEFVKTSNNAEVAIALSNEHNNTSRKYYDIIKNKISTIPSNLIYCGLCSMKKAMLLNVQVSKSINEMVNQVLKRVGNPKLYIVNKHIDINSQDDLLNCRNLLNEMNAQNNKAPKQGGV